jgi:hypothetical protein
MHHDYFGMSQLGGTRQGAPEVTAALDQGHQATVQYTLTVTPKIRTRLVATGEYLSYTVEDSTPDAITEYARPAFYALLEQTLHRHHVWVAYGQDFEGECRRASGGPCTTTGLGAKLGTLGYMFDLDDNLNVHLVGYQLFNDVSSRHSTFPPLETESPGLDITGIGLGVFYAFDVGLHP